MRSGDDDIAGAATLPASPHALDKTLTSASGVASPVRLVAGEHVGRYVLVDQIGEGGMGVVWAAHDPELDRTVAIKLVHTIEASDRSRSRLAREAQAMAKLSHPSVVPIFDVGTVGGQLFIAMELVDGETLRDKLRGARWETALPLFVAAGRGLAAAHAAGIVHRDFKPSNVLVGRDGRARVTDFGLARLADASSDAEGEPAGKVSGDAWKTRTGHILGTPAYMAPEQHRGDPTDARSDQFSFCVALWEIVCGEHPFADEKSDAQQLVTAVIAGELRTPARRGAVPAWLKRILVRGLAVDPAARWPSMTVLVDALEEAPRRRRRRAAMLAGLAALAAAATAVAAALVLGREVTPAADPCADLSARLAGVWDDAARERGRTAFIGTKLAFATTAWERTAARLDTYAEGWTAKATRSCQAAANHIQSSEDTARRERCLDGRLAGLRAFTTQLAVPDLETVQRAVEAVARLPDPAICDDLAALREAPLPPADPAQRSAADALAAELDAIDAETLLGHYRAALPRARIAVESATKLDYPPTLARALFLAGYAESGLGEPAATTLQAAIDAADRARDDHLRANALTELAEVLTIARQLDAAEAAMRTARAVLGRLGSEPRMESVVRAREARIALGSGDFARAQKLYEEALAWAERITPADLLFASRARMNLAVNLERQHLTDQALAQLARARDDFLATVGPDHPDLANYFTAEAGYYYNRDEYVKATELLAKALAQFERVLGPDSRQASDARYNLAQVYIESGHATEAIGLLTAGAAAAVRRLGPDHVDTATWFGSLSEAYVEANQLDEAIAAAERALAIYAKDPRSPPQLVSSPKFALAKALWLRGRDRARAQQLFADVRAIYAGQDDELVQVIDAWKKEHGVPGPRP